MVVASSIGTTERMDRTHTHERTVTIVVDACVTTLVSCGGGNDAAKNEIRINTHHKHIYPMYTLVIMHSSTTCSASKSYTFSQTIS